MCQALRACEARVIDAFLASDTMKVIRSGESEHGYHAALDAARDAVDALSPRYDGEWRIKYTDALAAIDALREGK